MEKLSKIVVSVSLFILAVAFFLREIAIEHNIEGLKTFFDLEGASSGSSCYIISFTVCMIIALLVWAYDYSKAFRIISMILLFGYGLIQMAFLLITLGFASGGFDDGFVTMDICRYFVTMLLSFIPAAILGCSE